MSTTRTIKVRTSHAIDSWVDFLNTSRVATLDKVPDIVYFDVSDLYFIFPYHVVGLACLIEEYHLKGAQIRFKTSESSGSVYLDRLRFFDYWRANFRRNEYHTTDVGTAFCPWKLDKEMIHAYVINAQKYYHDNYFSGRDLQPLNTALAEIFNNIIDHSKSAVSGYVFTQYYPNASDKRIVLAVCDFGKGIPDTVNNFLKKTEDRTLSNDAALQLAFKKGFSTKSTPSNRGFGLDNIASLVKSLKSTLLFISNNALVRQQKDGKLVKELLSESFPGTQIVIELQTKNLKRLTEEEINDEEFYL